MPGPPRATPIGLQLARTSKAVSRAFDEALDASGGSRPVWLVLVALKSHEHSTQQELARAVDIQGATLTHHLDAMEGEGLLTRRRDPENRRAHRVELTAKGEAMFQRLRAAAAEFDRRLRAGLTEGELARLGELLARLRANVEPDAGEARGRR